MNLKRTVLTACVLFAAWYSKAQDPANLYKEQYRGQVHFSPKAHWVNDPNGMVYYKGTYHLFYQYYPQATHWGPMHWGHAVSKDLMHWKELPIALYPDSLGYIFSGSAVADVNNTSGFGKKGKIPLVAIFTHHDPKGEKAGRQDYQNESIAYSLDEGKTWTKYKGNPVIKNPGIKDFRDPKVTWFAQARKWILTLATKDRVTFFSSPNLKEWKKESEFAEHLGAHGGVWECPDLFPMSYEGKTYWVLTVSLNPGGPNGGSATQYFVGQFDGEKFIPENPETKWVDYGPDDYAGVTWSNTGSRKIFLGWMSNWRYANQVPTENWRNAMTIPRELSLKKVEGKFYLASQPVAELKNIQRASLAVSREVLTSKGIATPEQYKLTLEIGKAKDFRIELSTEKNEQLLISYQEADKKFTIDRSKSGVIDFHHEFKDNAYAPRFSSSSSLKLELIADASSVELFADGGLTVMTAVAFPGAPYNHIRVDGLNPNTLNGASITPLKTIWRGQ